MFSWAVAFEKIVVSYCEKAIVGCGLRRNSKAVNFLKLAAAQGDWDEMPFLLHPNYQNFAAFYAIICLTFDSPSWIKHT